MRFFEVISFFSICFFLNNLVIMQVKIVLSVLFQKIDGKIETMHSLCKVNIFSLLHISKFFFKT